MIGSLTMRAERRIISYLFVGWPLLTSIALGKPPVKPAPRSVLRLEVREVKEEGRCALKPRAEKLFLEQLRRSPLVGEVHGPRRIEGKSKARQPNGYALVLRIAH